MSSPTTSRTSTPRLQGRQSLFEEYLKSGAHEDNFVGRDRRVSYVQDRGTFRDMTQGASEQTKNPLDVAIDGNAFLVVQTPAGERYTRDGGLQLNNQGQLVTVAGNPVLGTSGPIVFQPTDHDINMSPDGTITVVEGTGRTPIRSAASSAGELSRRAAAAEGGFRTSTPPAKARRRPTPNPRCARASSRSPTSTRWRR
jgi:flagellar hook-basal body protein